MRRIVVVTGSHGRSLPEAGRCRRDGQPQRPRVASRRRQRDRRRRTVSSGRSFPRSRRKYRSPQRTWRPRPSLARKPWLPGTKAGSLARLSSNGFLPLASLSGPDSFFPCRHVSDPKEGVLSPWKIDVLPLLQNATFENPGADGQEDSPISVGIHEVLSPLFKSVKKIKLLLSLLSRREMTYNEHDTRPVYIETTQRW